MADLDEVSRMFGEVTSDVRYMREWTEKHEDADQKRFEKLAERIDMLGLPLSRLGQIERDLAASIPVVEGIKKMKWIATGFVACVALVGGAVGSVAATALKWF